MQGRTVREAAVPGVGAWLGAGGVALAENQHPAAGHSFGTQHESLDLVFQRPLQRSNMCLSPL